MQRLKRNCNYCFMSNSVYHSDYNYRILIKLIAELFCFKAKSHQENVRFMLSLKIKP